MRTFTPFEKWGLSIAVPMLGLRAIEDPTNRELEERAEKLNYKWEGREVALAQIVVDFLEILMPIERDLLWK
jgi:hypothetical protein